MSSSDHDEATLPERVESLLVDWPVHQDPAFEERNAKAVQERLAGVESGSTPDDLLAAPLPVGDDEGTPSAGGKAAARKEGVPESARTSRPPESAPPQSLADLARAAVADAAKPADDASDIARESLSVASRSRTSAPDIAAVLASRPSRPSVPPASTPAPASEDQARPSHAATAGKRRSSGPLVAAGVALVGLAAAVAIFVRGHNQPPPLETNPQVQQQPVAAAAPAASAAPAPAKAAEEEKGVLSLDQLPNGELAAASKTAPSAGAHAAPRGKLAAAAPEDKSEVKVQLPGTASDKTTQDKPIPGMKPAEGTTNGLPDKPSTGAVAVAVGAVLGSARACVAGQDEPSHAVIVFGSDGRVKSVSVSGPAAGTPAAGCIRAALSQARLQPFARSTFSVGTPVRPQ